MSQALKQKWWEFHKANPQVYELFKRFTFEALRSGRKNYSAYAIFQRIRWHSEIETQGDDFKLNNNHQPYYARLFMHDHPQYDGFFRTRGLH
jgi:ABC-type proline/glycine betaine transport system substrate-binding protein